jgi:hypothetical protein
VWGSAGVLAKMLCRDGDGTCASGHRAGPPGLSIHYLRALVVGVEYSGGGWGDGWLWYHA